MVIKMNVPKLRFKGFTEEWQNYKIKDLGKIITGTTPPTSDKENYGESYLWASPIDMGINKYINNTKNKLSEKGFQKIRKIPANSVLITCIGSTIGKTAISKYEMSTNQQINSLICNKQFNYEYCYYCINFNFPKFLSKISFQAVPIISKSEFEKLTLAVTKNMYEQEKIGNMLSLLDKKIELQSKKIEALKLYKKGLINLVKNDWKNFKNYKINDIFKITRGVVIPKNKLSEEKNEIYKYPVYSSQTSNNGILGYDKIYDYDGKYLTWTTDGANAGKVFYRDGKFRCTNVCGILYEDNPLFTNEFVCELLNYETPKHVSYVGNPKLMNNVMENIDLKLPNNDILIKTSKLISLFNKKLENETTKLMKLHNLKKGLIQNMFV